MFSLFSTHLYSAWKRKTKLCDKILPRDFQGHLLQVLDDQSQCNRFGENLMNSQLNVVGDILFLFAFFRRHIFHLKNGD